MLPLHERLRILPQTGLVRWIGVRPAHGEPMRPLDEVLALADQGLDGDVASQARRAGKRQVTLVQEEHLPVLASFLGHEAITPDALRRNLVVRGINLVALGKLRCTRSRYAAAGHG
jgi:MOSC domain-containing protein YiiM